MENLKPITLQTNPPLYEWMPDPGEIFYSYDGENVVADYNGNVGKIQSKKTLYYVDVFDDARFHKRSSLDV